MSRVIPERGDIPGNPDEEDTLDAEDPALAAEPGGAVAGGPGDQNTAFAASPSEMISPPAARSGSTSISSAVSEARATRLAGVAGVKRTDFPGRRRPRMRRDLAAAGGSTFDAPESSVVLAALRALRRDGDPARARVLVDGYLRRHPAGVLAEEALAISIEAAMTHGDSDSRALAERYLRLYPSGPYHAVAERTLLSTRVAPPPPPS